MLNLTITATLAKAHAPFLRAKLRAAHKILNPQLTELSVVLVNDKTMIELHDRFMNDPTPTDVLTFPLDETSGEVIVCVPEARRRAKERHIELCRELLLYSLHGMLHLCGYDDKTDRAYNRMHRAEDRILTAIGVGATFEPKPKKI